MNEDEQKNKSINVEINDRQKAILSLVGLPDSYEKLTSSQKKSINSIEQMLQYLDKKYEKSFCYAGYSNGIYERQWLMAYAEGENPKVDVFNVVVEDDGRFNDDYPWIYYRRLYDDYLLEDLTKNCGISHIKVFTTTGKTDLQSVSDKSLEAMRNHITASSMVFICGENDVDMEKLIEEYLKWNKEYGFQGQCVVGLFQNRDDLIGLTRSNYMRMAGRIIESKHCSITKEGTYKIW